MYNKIDKISYDYLREIEDKIKNKDSVSKEELFYFLEYVVYDIRNKIYDEEHPNFEFKCDLAQSIICYFLDDIGVENYPYSTNKTFGRNVMGHSFVIATFKVNDKKFNYLIDPTYIQFFKKEECSDDNYLLISGVYVKTPNPGYFVSKDIIGENAFKRVMEFRDNGFDVFDEELAKIYGDSFYNTRNSKRNKKIDSLPGYYYINSLLDGGTDKLSVSKEELIANGYYIDFEKKKVK